jgi:hypothetical protein
MPQKKTPIKKPLAEEPKTLTPNTSKEELQGNQSLEAKRYSRGVKRLAKRPHRLSRKPSPKELKEILSHFSRRQIWDGIRKTRQVSKPKFLAKHPISLQKDKNGTLVWRYTTPLAGVSKEISTGVGGNPPKDKKINGKWLTKLRPEEQSLVLMARLKATNEQAEEERRAYILWNAIVGVLANSCLIYDSVHHAGVAVGIDEVSAGSADETGLDMIIPFFEAVGIDVRRIMDLLPFTRDANAGLDGDNMKRPGGYA